MMSIKKTCMQQLLPIVWYNDFCKTSRTLCIASYISNSQSLSVDFSILTAELLLPYN